MYQRPKRISCLCEKPKNEAFVMIVCGQVDEGQHQSWNDWVFWFQNNQNITGMLPRHCFFSGKETNF